MLSHKEAASPCVLYHSSRFDALRIQPLPVLRLLEECVCFESFVHCNADCNCIAFCSFSDPYRDPSARSLDLLQWYSISRSSIEKMCLQLATM
jgi:hypothetical protein